MEKDNSSVLTYGYQPGSENRGYQPSANAQNNNVTDNSTPPKGGNVAQKE